MGINDRNNSDQFDNALSVIRDGVSNSYSAKVDSDNRLWVNAKSSVVPSGLTALNSKLRYLDMNVSNGGIGRGTTVTNASWVDIFNRSGSGYLFFAIINLETSSDWELRILIDNEEIFFPSGITSNDLASDTVYDLDTGGKTINDLDSDIGIVIGSHDIITWHAPLGLPIYYATSVVIKIKRAAGKASKKFNAGLVALTDGF